MTGKRVLTNVWVWWWVWLGAAAGFAGSPEEAGPSDRIRGESFREGRLTARPYPTGSVWLDPDGQPLPFQEDEEVLDFLATARVVSTKRLSEGVNGIDKVLLEKVGVRAHAAFRDVSIHKRRMELPGAVRLDFRDDCIFELAAYRLARLLGLTNVPPVVQREVEGRKGTLQIWVENAMMEKERIAKKLRPPRPAAWLYQMQIMHLFDRLIFNDDRNQGNILIDQDWKVWLIDHTRAFRRFKKPVDLEDIRFCERFLWEKLKNLEASRLEQELEDVLAKAEIRGVISRRDEIVRHLEKLAETQGQTRIFF